MANATHNVLMADMLEIYFDITERNKKKKVDVYPQRKNEILQEHHEILTAIKERDPIKARQAMQQHINKARQQSIGRTAEEKPNS
ncbi:hypothetical protein SDC9_190183 [bioreactor metagenome]|uniref:GntR C-terminal domain-containing protein n=1 Tax=bioreactor metagenome TaxID=1076179 RepID=A0A645HVM6_9ZZZZ